MVLHHYDIVIVGAGIAGLSAAKAIADEGNVRLALIEGKGIGSNNPSPLTFTDILEKHRLDDCIKIKYSHFTFHQHQGSRIRYGFRGHPLMVLDYKQACRKLLKSAQIRKHNVDVLYTHAVNISQKDRYAIVHLQNDVNICGRILIDCSGRSKFSASQSEEHQCSYYSHVYGASFSGVDEKACGVCAFLLPHKEFGLGGGWFYGFPGGKASFGFAHVNRCPNVDTAQLKGAFNLARKKFAPYSDYLRDAKPDHVERGSIPISHIGNFVNYNRVIVGDAAGMATNWTCMGIESALEYGRLAGEISVKALCKNDVSVLTRFQNQWLKENKEIYDMTAKNTEKFWIGDFAFWEWIIKNDLAFLSPRQVLGRMRKNEHLQGKRRMFLKALAYKVKTIVDKNFLKPQSFLISG